MTGARPPPLPALDCFPYTCTCVAGRAVPTHAFFNKLWPELNRGPSPNLSFPPRLPVLPLHPCLSPALPHCAHPIHSWLVTLEKVNSPSAPLHQPLPFCPEPCPNPKPRHQVYAIDLFDNTPDTVAAIRARGDYPVCYFSAGTAEDYRPDYGELLPSDLGAALPDYPQERYVDVTSTNVRRIMVNVSRLLARGPPFAQQGGGAKVCIGWHAHGRVRWARGKMHWDVQKRRLACAGCAVLSFRSQPAAGLLLPCGPDCADTVEAGLMVHPGSEPTWLATKTDSHPPCRCTHLRPHSPTAPAHETVQGQGLCCC